MPVSTAEKRSAQATISPVAAPSPAALRAARYSRLRYLVDSAPGIRRVKAGSGFTYVNARGRPVSAGERRRIRALVIPPAWRRVWISPLANGHLQAQIVKRCQDLPGQELFQYLDEEGRRRAVTSADVNEYLRAATGLEFTAKDFRTWSGTVLAACALRELDAFETEPQAKRNIVAAIDVVAGRLGNTRAVCRGSYIHPLIWECYADGSLLRAMARRATGSALGNRLSPDEKSVMKLIATRTRRKSRHVEH